MDFPALTWGLSLEKIQEFAPDTEKLAQKLYFHSVHVQNFPTDCGALLLNNTSYATLHDLQNVIKYASKSGFSKIFCTIVDKPYIADAAKETFKKAGFRCISSGFSNRNPYKRDYVMFKRVRCSYKGY